MTRSPKSGNEQEPSNRRLWLLLLGRTSLAVGVILLAGIAGGVWWARNYVYKDLAPLVENNLQQLLGRPVKLGAVERFSLSSLRFGALSVPATPNDPDRVAAKAVDVQFSPLRLLFNRTLALNVTLVEPDVYLEQDKQGRWVTTQLKTGDGKGIIQTELQTIRLQNGDVVLVPNPTPNKPKGSVALDQVNGTARILSQNQGIGYDLGAQPTTGGTVKIVGETQLKTLQTNVKLQAQNLEAANVSRLIELPIALQSGRVDADLGVQLQPDQQEPNKQEIAINGTAIANKVTAQIQNVPQKFINSIGKLTFQGQTVGIESLTTNYGTVPVLANGSLNLQTGYNISAQVKAVSAKNLLDTLNVKLPVPVAGEVQSKIQLQGAIQQPILSGTASNIKPVQVDRVLFNGISTGFRLSLSKAASGITVSNLQLIPAAGGQITGNGQIQLGSKPQQGGVKFNLQAEGVSADALASAYGLTLPTSIGNVSAKAEVSGSPGGGTQPLTLNISSVQATPPAGGQITANGRVQLVPQGNVALNVQAQGIPANAIAQGYGVSVPINIGGVSANATVSGRLGAQPLTVNVASVKATPEVGGQITANGQVQLAPKGRVSFNVQAQNLPGDAIAKAYKTSPPITIGNVSANARIFGSLGNLQTVAQVSAPTATYPTSGQVVVNQQGNSVLFQDAVVKVAGSTIRGRGQLAQGRWQAFVNADQLQLSRFAQVPPQLQGGVLSSQLNLSGTTASFQPSTIQASGQASLRNVAGGTVNVRNISLDNGRWQALANVSQVQLNRFSQQLQGRLNSNLQLAGTTESFALSNIRAAGQVGLSQGLSLLAQPITAQVQWNGQQIILQNATSPGLSANGVVAVQVPETGTPQVSGFNLNVQARNYNLQKASSNLPGNIALAGRLNFTGQVTGTPTTPNAVGNIRLENLNVSGLAFDPVLAGNVKYQGGQGGQLQLAGRQDEIAVNIDANNRPSSFLFRRDQAVATGRTEGENLLVNVRDFPVAILSGFVPNNTLKPLAGQASGDLVVNLNNYAAAGEVAIAKPVVGRVTADEFRGNITYADGAASLTNGQLRIAESSIALSGNVQTGNNPQFQFQANFDQTRIDRLLQAFNVFDFGDFGGGLQGPDLAGAEVLQTQPRSLPDTDLLTQLKYFSQIATRVVQEQAQQKEPTTLPTLAELQGALSGGIEVAGSLKSGLNASFNFQGNNWQWGNYSINDVIARGTFANGVVTLLPLRVDLNPGSLAFTGQLGTEQLSGQLRVASLPLSLLQPFIERYPVDVTGNVNAVATLGGDLKDPRAIGELTLVDGTINKQAVQTGQVSFNYNNARLNFGSTVLVTGTQPVQIAGSVPFGLPFASVQPDSNQISINARVQDEGLALLNLFTNQQVTWVNGQGQVNVDVQGTLNQPIINGVATVNNATFQAQALPDPLTNVTGTLQFNGDTLTVESLQGQYNKGAVSAAGVLPIFARQGARAEAATNPLTVSVNNLDLNVQGLYQGGVSGDVVIGGTALSPDIGGTIQLNDGQVLIGQSNTAGAKPSGTQKDSATDNATTIFRAQPTNTQGTSTPDGATTTFGAQPTNTQGTSTPDGATTTFGLEQPGTQDNAAATATRPNLPIEFDGLRLILGNNVRVSTAPILGGFVPGGELSPSLLTFDAKGNLTINGTLAKPLPQGVIRLTGGRVNLFTTQFTLDRGYEHTAEFTPSRGLDPVLDVRLVTLVPEATGATANRTLRSPFSSEISDVSATSFGTLRTVRVQARATGPASQLAENLELTSEPSRSKAEIISLLGGSIINSLGQSDATTGLVTLAGSTIFGSLQGSITAIGQAIGFSEFRIYPSPVTTRASRNSDQRETSSVLGLAAEGVFDISRNFSVSLSRVFLTNEPFNYNVIYRVNDDLLVRGSTNLADDSRLLFEYETRF
ncbi:translocation/assembly module TamB domain-containing protein [Scytonema sp. PCC 10023]|uniref:translocation/assembly module TamB domain-containing protein n=1 Tax=Scytonema sp. PCC 10023 TaxID=1680591 RepID=UPI0039C602D9